MTCESCRKYAAYAVLTQDRMMKRWVERHLEVCFACSAWVMDKAEEEAKKKEQANYESQSPH